MFRPSLSLILSFVVALPLAGCDQLGIETPAQTAARQENEGKAVGGACRHAGRALEDCYRSSPKTSKAAIYSGWRDMDAYMRENKLDVVLPANEREAAKSPGKAEAEETPPVAPVQEEAPTPPKGGKSKQS
jgi:hypothetical protein